MECRALSLLAGFTGLAVMAGCVDAPPSPSLTWREPEFNQRIRHDFAPLTPQDAATDLRYGFFRDGSDGGLVSELFPVAASSPVTLPASLVQTPCLFVGAEHDAKGKLVGSDQLRLAWEVIARWEIVGEADERIVELFQTSNMRLGLCSLSTPERRLFLDNVDAPLTDFDHNISCHPEAETYGLSFAFTATIDPEGNYNIPNRCVRGHPYPVIQLEAVARQGDAADATCPSPHFDGEASVVREGNGAEGWYQDFWSVCGYAPNHATPQGDASYRLSFQEANHFSSETTDRWMSPSILHVPGKRSIVRPLPPAAPGSTQGRWQTRIDQPGGPEGPLRWAENFTPTVQVEAVEVITRDLAGANEQAVAPDDRKLTITVPRPGLPTTSVVCTLKTGSTRFAIPGDCTMDDPLLSVLTPTYATAYLNSTPGLTTPMSWTAELRSLPQNRRAHIRFLLRAKAQPALMRISAQRDFGTLQVGTTRQGSLTLENVGGQPLLVRSIGFAPGSAHPGDFSFVVKGDPVEVPLPIEAVPDPAGGSRLQLSADAKHEPILTLTEVTDGVQVSIGDPDRGATPQALTIYGEPARLIGGTLLRDDPAATFRPGGTWPRPFTITTFAERQPPFALAAGQSATIDVTVQPGGLGLRSALLRVQAESLAAGTPLTATASLRADSRQGPQLHLAPSRLWFSETASGSGLRRAALIDNVGTYALDVTRLVVQGPHAARFAAVAQHGAPPFTLDSGGYDDLWITYTPECDGAYGSSTSVADHFATLVIESTGGNVALDLSGSSQGFCVP